jgi:hypothetical protein
LASVNQRVYPNSQRLTPPSEWFAALTENDVPYDTLPELLALRAIVQFLLTEEVSKYQDVNGAVHDISKSCPTLLNDANVGAADPERIRQSALRYLDDIFMNLKLK